MRATDEDRNAAERRLREATRQGALTLQEYDERLGQVYQVRERAELEPLLADLPAARSEPEAPHEPASGRRRWLIAVMSGHEERGVWRPGRRASAVAVMGGVEMDLRHAQVDQGELTVDAVAVMGGIEIIVPRGVEVELRGFAFMGGRENTTEPVTDPSGARRLIVNGWALMGGVEIRHAKPEERRRDERDEAEVVEAPTWEGWEGGSQLGAHRAPSASSPARRATSSRTSWWKRLAAAAVLALGLATVVDADAVSVFGSQSLEVDAAPETTQEVEAYSLFGSVEVIVPEGVRVDMEGIGIFASRQCDACVDNPAAEEGAPVVEIRGVSLFGSAKVVRPDQR